MMWWEVLKFILFWMLTLLYAVLCIFYLLISTIFSKPTEFRGRASQPNCLSDPSYGRHRFFKRKDIKLHYVEAGEPGNPVVIFIHEAPGFWFCWRKQIPALAEHFHVISLDLRGCGDSDKSTILARTSNDAIIEDIKELYKVLGITSANIVCNETSGIFGWHLATSYPHMVKKMVLLNSPHPYVTRILFHSSIRSYIKMWYLLLLQIPFLPELLLNRRYHNSLRKSMEQSMKKGSMTDEEIEAYMYNFSRREDWVGSLELIRQIDVRPIIKPLELEVISCHTLLLMGTQYPYVPIEAAYRSAEFVERIKIKPVEGGGCTMQATHFNKINEELMKFLVRSPSPDVIKPARNSLVGRVFGAVKNPYHMISSSEFFLDKFGTS